MPKALIDCDAFFASCEQAKNPSLKGKMVLVSGPAGSRSVVSSASYEAKRQGVKAGMSPIEAERLCPGAVFLPGDFDLYITYNKMMETKLRSMGLDVEVSSIDEFYVDLGCKYAEAENLLRGFSAWVESELGITVSIGLAPTRTLAKLASEIVKPRGLTVLTPETLPDSISYLGVGRLLGIGKVTAAYLRSRGIHSLGSLLAAPDEVLSEFGYDHGTIRGVLCGECDIVDDGADMPPKSISSRMTLAYDTLEAEDIAHHLRFLCDHVSWRLRREGMCAKVLTVTARYNDFSTSTRSRTLPYYVSYAQQLAEFALPLWDAHYKKGRKLRLIGLGLSGLISASDGELQTSILPSDRAWQDMTRTVDEIRKRYGSRKLISGSYLMIDSKRRT
ncbi:MAG TPA: DNA polymerase IV [Bacillota bacterium]|nr:DNA polymerase IV [Bacillota bacterium]HOH10433.1 DNA polymerase IV [Bacillota bacterium]HOS50961.1 DNA polymerase IV [Bacillota bacterium]HPI01049.1 DNA polymerase IV [Bacillota bacterium]HPM63146.1 DNA polymerase IV [Bacillota bacterium]